MVRRKDLGNGIGNSVGSFPVELMTTGLPFEVPLCGRLYLSKWNSEFIPLKGIVFEGLGVWVFFNVKWEIKQSKSFRCLHFSAQWWYLVGLMKSQSGTGFPIIFLDTRLERIRACVAFYEFSWGSRSLQSKHWRCAEKFVTINILLFVSDFLFEMGMFPPTELFFLHFPTWPYLM